MHILTMKIVGSDVRSRARGGWIFGKHGNAKSYSKILCPADYHAVYKPDNGEHDDDSINPTEYSVNHFLIRNNLKPELRIIRAPDSYPLIIDASASEFSKMNDDTIFLGIEDDKARMMTADELMEFHDSFMRELKNFDGLRIYTGLEIYPASYGKGSEELTRTKERIEKDLLGACRKARMRMG